MDINDIRVKKNITENKIFQLLTEFETETTLKISHVRVVQMELSGSGILETVGIEIKTKPL